MSKVVTLDYPEAAIAEVTLKDHTYHNTFSPELMEGLISVFSSLHPETKVVVIHGYDNYFCCGGTKDELIELTEGTKTFLDLAFYRLLLDCEIPTIAAMQGHAIGGGLAFGCYADLIVMSEESLYSTNFMKYGFTPGMGATYIIPKKLGEALGHEMLYTALNYHGKELKQRGALVKIVKRNDVIPTAFSIARDIADKPLISLKLLKKHFTEKIKTELPIIIDKELAMHAKTFILPEVKERINKSFGK